MFNVSEYRKNNKPLSDYLPWALFIKPGILLNKDGSFQKIYQFRGPDLDSSTKHELIAARNRFNNVIRQFGSSWCLHVEARRRKSQKYHKSQFPDAASEFFDRERQHNFERDRNQYETDYFFSLTLVPAALITAINSDLPGDVIAQVTEHVYDTVTGRFLLIPQGSRLYGRYDSVVSYGQERVLVAWQRLVLPNGKSFSLMA